MATTALISDLHLGAASSSDVLRRAPIRERLFESIADSGADRIVLLGDAVELRDGPLGDSLREAEEFFTELGEAFAGREVVLVPGNHDHRLLGPWLERTPEEQRPGALDELVTEPHPAVRSIAGWLGEAALEVRYPGIWVREDVYATHGHYLDSHVTLPTIERISVAAVDRLAGTPTGRRETPLDYEEVHAPVYDLIFNLAQGRRGFGSDEQGRSRALRIWETIGGASGKARTIRGKLLGSALIPATLHGLERAGLGRFNRDFSISEIGRAGVSAMHDVVERLGIEADHVIFGHIHRRGSLPGDNGSAGSPAWSRNGVTLHNTGNWLYTEALLGRAVPQSPFWPGSMVVVPETGPPELVEVLVDVDREVLAGRVGGSRSGR
ncbi:MAG: metallophosphoesterase [Solirubrobacterales bacterium]|nr:metallophosphoesterase [Solirubrobacterales bacterium]